MWKTKTVANMQLNVFTLLHILSVVLILLTYILWFLKSFLLQLKASSSVL